MDLQAFETRVLPAKNKLFRFAFRFLGNEEEAKDVVQEVFLKIWNNRSQMNHVQNWEAWCMRMTRNLSLDRLRISNRRITEGLDGKNDLRHSAMTPYESTELNEHIKRISEVIAALPDKQRQVIHLRDVEGYSYQEICDILELDMNQVKVNLFRARNAVRVKLLKLDTYGL